MFDAEPEGWRSGFVGDLISEVADRIDPGQIGSRDLPYVGLEHMEQGTGRLSGVGRASEVVSQKSRFSAGDILYGKLRPNLRKVARPDFDGVCSTDIVVFRAKAGADADYAFQLLQSAPLVAHAVASSAGTKMPRTHARSILKFQASAPPLDEQRRIAEVLRSVGATREAGKKVVEAYGDVIQTEIDSVVADLVADPKTPMARLGDVSTVKGGKRLPKGSEYSDSPTGFRYVRVTDWDDYEIDPAHVRWISSEAASSIRRYTIASADLFISIAGSIGLVASVPAELNGAYLTENAAKIVLRDDVEIDREYLLLVMRSGSLTN